MNFVTRTDLLEVCGLVYDRWLTNAGGSNFSGRLTADTVLVTTTGNAKRTRLRMNADQLLHVRLDGTVLEGDGELSSSWPTHRGLYEAFAEHWRSHPCAPLLCNDFRGARSGHSGLARWDEEVRNHPLPFRPPQDRFPSLRRRGGQRLRSTPRRPPPGRGFGVLYPGHGVLVAGPRLDDAYDLLERMEFNAAALILGSVA